MKIKIDEAKTVEFKIDTSSGCSEEDLQGYLRFSFGGVEYGFPAVIKEGVFSVEIPPFKNVINDRLTESISKNKELIVKGRLDVIANKTTYVSPWNGEIDIEIPVSMEISEGGTLDEKKKVTVSDPDKDSVIDAFNEVMNPKADEAVKVSKFKDVMVTEPEEKDPHDGGIDGKEKEPTDEMCGADHEKEEKKKKKKIKEEEGGEIIDKKKKSRFAESLEKTYVKGA